jgi:hypothetical protein
LIHRFILFPRHSEAYRSQTPLLNVSYVMNQTVTHVLNPHRHFLQNHQ